MQDTTPAHREAAERLIEAVRDHRPCEPIRQLLPDGTVDDGYLVQQLVAATTGRGRRLAGRKVGLTSPAVQLQMGVDAPDFGLLYADMAYGDSQPVPFASLLQPRVEGEVAFVLGADLAAGPVTPADVLRATDFVVPAVEVVDSRIRDWDISIVDTIGDNASSGKFVLGGTPRHLTGLPDLRECEMRLTRNGEVLSHGTGAACLGHPVNAVTWLANVVASRGAPLRAGEVVLSGALGPLVAAEAGATYEVTIDGLGSVRAVFTA